MLWNHPTLTSFAAHVAGLMAPAPEPEAAPAEEISDDSFSVLDALFDSVESTPWKATSDEDDLRQDLGHDGRAARCAVRAVRQSLPDLGRRADRRDRHRLPPARGINGPEQYWEFLDSGSDAVTVVPADRWDAEAYYDPDPMAPGRMPTRWGRSCPMWPASTPSSSASPRVRQWRWTPAARRTGGGLGGPGERRPGAGQTR